MAEDCRKWFPVFAIRTAGINYFPGRSPKKTKGRSISRKAQIKYGTNRRRS